MLSKTSPAVDNGHVGSDAGPQDMQSEYARLRKELERLLIIPVKDFQKIDALVDQLEQVQLAFKAQHGVKGNNPNE